MEEAAREGNSRSSVGSGGSSADDKVLDSIPFYATTLPTKVAARFVSTLNFFFVYLLLDRVSVPYPASILISIKSPEIVISYYIASAMSIYLDWT